MTTLFAEQPNILPPMKSNEWYTPSRYIEAARKVMNGIDLDPASCFEANQTIRATRYYTQDKDGLARDWTCKSMWLNPPYGKDTSLPNELRSNIAKWVERLVGEYETGHVEQAVLLATLQTQARWFAPLWKYSICFSDHNVRFYLPNGSNKVSRPGRMTDGHIYGTCFVYLGPNEAAFIEHFSPFGRIAKAIDTPKSSPTTRSLWEEVPECQP